MHEFRSQGAHQPPRGVADLLRRAYAAFNARDIDAALATVQADVDWPNVLDGVRLHGHAAVRQYWARQFVTFDPHVEPIGMTVDDEEQVSVRVHQVLRSLDGRLLSDTEVTHVYMLRDGLIARMDVLPAGPGRAVGAGFTPPWADTSATLRASARPEQGSR